MTYDLESPTWRIHAVVLQIGWNYGRCFQITGPEKLISLVLHD